MHKIGSIITKPLFFYGNNELLKIITNSRLYLFQRLKLSPCAGIETVLKPSINNLSLNAF